MSQTLSLTFRHKSPMTIRRGLASCMTVEAYEDKVLAGDGRRLYLLSHSIQEV